MKIIITFYYYAFLGSSAFPRIITVNFILNFNNYNKTFTQKIDMNESEFRDPKELSLLGLTLLLGCQKRMEKYLEAK